MSYRRFESDIQQSEPKHHLFRHCHNDVEAVLMPTAYKIYRLKDFIRKDESGELNADRVHELVYEIGHAAARHPDHNILLDFRETTITNFSMTGLLKMVEELEKFKFFLENKIANVVPTDEDRLAIARKTEAALQLKGFRYRYFTDFESAIEWLAD